MKSEERSGEITAGHGEREEGVGERRTEARRLFATENYLIGYMGLMAKRREEKGQRDRQSEQRMHSDPSLLQVPGAGFMGHRHIILGVISDDG